MSDTSSFKTDQERFWAGDFGEEYINRNKDKQILSGNINLFSKILYRTVDIKSILELGANIGLNLIAISKLLPETTVSAIEINKKAVKELEKIDNIEEIYSVSILDYDVKKKYDLVFTKGVLIHINPNELTHVYNIMYESSNKYILVAEYYNPTPAEVIYRGHKGKLFKRDFAGDIMDMYPDIKLIDYGFSYHRDSNFLQDDITWFLLKKES